MKKTRAAGLGLAAVALAGLPLVSATPAQAALPALSCRPTADNLAWCVADLDGQLRAGILNHTPDDFELGTDSHVELTYCPTPVRCKEPVTIARSAVGRRIEGWGSMTTDWVVHGGVGTYCVRSVQSAGGGHDELIADGHCVNTNGTVK